MSPAEKWKLAETAKAELEQLEKNSKQQRSLLILRVLTVKNLLLLAERRQEGNCLQIYPKD